MATASLFRQVTAQPCRSGRPCVGWAVRIPAGAPLLEGLETRFLPGTSPLALPGGSPTSLTVVMLPASEETRREQ